MPIYSTWALLLLIRLIFDNRDVSLSYNYAAKLIYEECYHISQNCKAEELKQRPAPRIRLLFCHSNSRNARCVNQAKQHNAKAGQRCIVCLQFVPQGYISFIGASYCIDYCQLRDEYFLGGGGTDKGCPDFPVETKRFYSRFYRLS
jgi:hypothetical protein